MDKRIAIVTGGAGFIGEALVRRLFSDDWNVVVIDDFSTHDKISYADYGNGNYVQFYQAPVQHVAPRWPRVDAIFHLAGKVGPVGVLKYAGQIANDTITANDTVGNWAEHYGCPLIDISTSEIYGSPDSSNKESDPKVFPYPASARMEYAVAKLAAETMLLNRPIDVRVVRPFNIAGPTQRPEGGFVIPRFVQQALDGDPLTVYAPGTQKRSFTHIDDFIDGLMLVLRDGAPKEVYNLGNPNNECTMMELAAAVVYLTKSSSRIDIIDPTTLHGKSFREAADKVPDSGLAMLFLGWSPWRTTGMIIDETIKHRRPLE